MSDGDNFTDVEMAWLHVIAFIRTLFEAQDPEVRSWLETNVGTSVHDIHDHIRRPDGMLVITPSVIDYHGRSHLIYNFLIYPPAVVGPVWLGSVAAETLKIPADWRAADLQTAADLELRLQPVPDDLSGLVE